MKLAAAIVFLVGGTLGLIEKRHFLADGGSWPFIWWAGIVLLPVLVLWLLIDVLRDSTKRR